jgi:acyl-CoA thioesterase FadM
MNPVVFRDDIFIGFHLTDAAGIVYFANVPSLAHQTMEKFVTEQFGWDKWFRHKESGAPVRHVDVDYRAPFRAGQYYQAELRLLPLGNSSLSYEVSFLKDKKICAIVKIVHVFISFQTHKPISIPEDLRLGLEKCQRSN